MSKTYSDNPVDMAKRFEDIGCQRLHLVDLDGARSKHIVNYKTLESISSKTNLTVDFGGGIKSDKDVKIAFECGASMITGGSIAVTDRTEFLSWLAAYGSDRIILGADTRNGNISVNGWHDDCDIDVMEFIRTYHSAGIRQVISTDINVDGTLQGPSLKLYQQILDSIPDIYLIASGGVGHISDIDSLTNAGLPAVIVGKAIYEGHITLSDIERHNLHNI